MFQTTGVSASVSHPHAHVVLSSFIIPIVATAMMELVESIADPSPFDWRERQVKTGWDLCVLAVGSSGAIFTLPEVQQLLGNVYSVDFGVLALLFTVIFGLCVAAIRKTPKDRLAGWQGWLALGLGGTALGIPWYIVMQT